MNCAWKRLSVLVVLVSLVLLSLGSAHAATEVGIRYGRADLRGDRLFPGSGDMGATPLFGIQLVLDILPFVDVELAGEAYDEDFRFNRVGDITAVGEGNYQDTAILATGKLGLPITLLGPGSLYGGLGLSAHFLDVSMDATVPGQLLADPEEDLESALKDITGERTELEWHVVIGIKTGIRVLPLSAFAEVRYQDILESDTPDLGSAYLGVNFRFGE